MSWRYTQKTGLLEYTDDGQEWITIGTGYSGHGAGLNNPAMQAVHDVGPIPCGGWTIGDAENHPHLGPVAMPLTPKEGTETFGRSGFFDHGDNGKHDHSASCGCIVMNHDIRIQQSESGDRDLLVVAE